MADQTTRDIYRERMRGNYAECVLATATQVNTTTAVDQAEAAIDGIARALQTILGRRAAFSIIQRRVDAMGDDLIHSLNTAETPPSQGESA